MVNNVDTAAKPSLPLKFIFIRDGNPNLETSDFFQESSEFSNFSADLADFFQGILILKNSESRIRQIFRRIAIPDVYIIIGII